MAFYYMYNNLEWDDYPFILEGDAADVEKLIKLGQSATTCFPYIVAELGEVKWRLAGGERPVAFLNWIETVVDNLAREYLPCMREETIPQMVELLNLLARYRPDLTDRLDEIVQEAAQLEADYNTYCGRPAIGK